MSNQDRTIKIPCTVQIFTLNSGQVLRRCLESLKDFDDILILDGNSTDNTLEIAREFTEHIIKQADTDQPNYRIKDFSVVRNKGIQEGKYDWNFYLDTDEELPKRTAQEIREIVSKSTIEHYVYKLPGHINYNHREIKYSVAYPGYQMRLMNRKSEFQQARTPHHRLAISPGTSVGVMENPWFVIVEPKGGLQPYEPTVHYSHIQIEIRESSKVPLGEFLYWFVWRKTASLINTILRTVWLYVRHGFKDTLPPSMEFKRIEYKWLLLTGAIRFRLKLALFGERKL